MSQFTLHDIVIEYEHEGEWRVESVDIEKTMEAFKSGRQCIHSKVFDKLSEKFVADKELPLPIWLQQMANAISSHISIHYDDAVTPKPETLVSAATTVQPPPEEAIVYRRS
ncbi:MAG: hypothetical protein EB168_10915 [Euryarchaeota archaeon]|nr:hypothetical protein [Euryarchaeota archaeon]NDF22777.1 hypothetical protein [Euryarchaeota archaeon]